MAFAQGHITPALYPMPTVVFCDNKGSATDATIYNFTNTNLGEPAFDRVLVFGTCTRLGGVMVAQIGTDIAVNQVTTITGGADRIALHTLPYPNPVLTGTVKVTSSGSARCGLAVWACYGVDPTPYGTDATNISPANSQITVSQNSIALAYVYNATAHTTTWSGTMGVVEDFDSNDVEGQGHSGASCIVANAKTNGTMISTFTSSTDPCGVSIALNYNGFK